MFKNISFAFNNNAVSHLLLAMQMSAAAIYQILNVKNIRIKVSTTSFVVIRYSSNSPLLFLSYLKDIISRLKGFIPVSYVQHRF